MTKKHLKRIFASNKLPIERKVNKFMIRPFPGAQKRDVTVSIGTLLKEMLKVCKTSKEVKHILNTSGILVNGRKIRDIKYPVGLMDIISLGKTKEKQRLLLNSKAKLVLLKLGEDESKIIPGKISGKTSMKKGITQLNLSNGINKSVKTDSYKVGDTIILDTDKRDVKNHFKLEKGNLVYFISGKHIGSVATLSNIKGKNVVFKKGKETFETLKKYAFVIGKEKAVIRIPE